MPIDPNQIVRWDQMGIELESFRSELAESKTERNRPNRGRITVNSTFTNCYADRSEPDRPMGSNGNRTRVVLASLHTDHRRRREVLPCGDCDCGRCNPQLLDVARRVFKGPAGPSRMGVSEPA